MKTLYIAGPMRTYKCMNFPQFFYFQVLFEKSGYKVINPAELDCERWFNDGWVYTDDQYNEILEADCKIIREQVDVLFVLTGWEDSEGACREIAEAHKKGILVTYQDIVTEKSK